MFPTRAGPRWHWYSALAGALISALAAGGVLLWQRRPDPPPIVVHPPPTPAVVTPMPTPTPPPLVVFVTGAVHAPGLYSLLPGARVGDALAAAGGLTPEASPAAVNQAAPLRDGDQVYVPTTTEVSAPLPGVSSVGTSAGTSPGDPAAAINVNTATQAELESLPGIGPSLAQAIIANRPYATVDELDRVPGIGPAKLADLRPYVVVQ